jgi:hypothetical protein
MVEEHGRRWKFLEELFPGRKDISLKNRHRLLLRQRGSRERPLRNNAISTEQESDHSTDPGVAILEDDSLDPLDSEC